MKKVIIVLWCLLFLGCTDNPEPEPRDYQLTDVGVAGGRFHYVGEEVSMFIEAKDIPRKSNWSLVYKIDGDIIHVEPIPKDYTSMFKFHRFIPTERRTYEFHGCLSNGNTEVCQRAGIIALER